MNWAWATESIITAVTSKWTTTNSDDSNQQHQPALSKSFYTSTNRPCRWRSRLLSRRKKIGSWKMQKRRTKRVTGLSYLRPGKSKALPRSVRLKLMYYKTEKSLIRIIENCTFLKTAWAFLRSRGNGNKDSCNYTVIVVIVAYSLKQNMKASLFPKIFHLIVERLKPATSQDIFYNT